MQKEEKSQWFTPMKFLLPAREVLGYIDLDPASCAEANANVQAARFFTVTDDGLKQPWGSTAQPLTIYCNPPYRHLGWWVEKALTEFGAGHVSRGILLVTASVETSWFQRLWPFPICFPIRRIKFDRPAHLKNIRQPRAASAFVFLSEDPAHNERFVRIFSQFGKTGIFQSCYNKELVA